MPKPLKATEPQPPPSFADLLTLLCAYAGAAFGAVAPGAATLPPGLHLSHATPCAFLPDGRALPLDLPPAAYARLYPDLYEVA